METGGLVFFIPTSPLHGSFEVEMAYGKVERNTLGEYHDGFIGVLFNTCVSNMAVLVLVMILVLLVLCVYRLSDDG